MSVVYYALGGGHGHALRAFAVLRALHRLQPSTRRLAVVPGRMRPWADWAQVPAAEPPVDADRSRLRRWVRSILGQHRPDLFLVDVFPRGVLGELDPATLAIAPRRWLVSRWVRPSLYLAAAVRGSIESCFESLLWTEEPAKDLLQLDVRSEVVGPVLIATPAECLARPQARRALGVADDDTLTMVLGSGDRAHQEDLVRLISKIARHDGAERRRPHRVVVASDRLRPYRDGLLSVGPLLPATRYLRAADVAVAAGGYHAYHETRALGVPSVFVPQSRLVDDQFRRAGSDAVDGPEELELELIRLWSSAERPTIAVTDAADGAREIAERICRELCGSPGAADTVVGP